MRRPMRAAAPVERDGPRINEMIRVREVQLIDAEGENRGVIQTRDAVLMAV
ncbi:MAG: translation initiation factor IF-3, partial [Phreatobacter sp.]|nr:translation initiation factor IF-3 [Phreatobacter sp.]